MDIVYSLARHQVSKAGEGAGGLSGSSLAGWRWVFDTMGGNIAQDIGASVLNYFSFVCYLSAI